METLEGVLIQDERHAVVYGDGGYVSFYISGSVRIKSTTSVVNPFVIYSFTGTYEGPNTFRVTTTTMSPMEPNRYFHDISRQFIQQNSLANGADGNQSLIRLRSAIHLCPELSFWFNPKIYRRLRAYYLSSMVYRWSLATCTALVDIIDDDPFSLTYQTPFEEMGGLSINLDTVLSKHAVTEENQNNYNIAVAAEYFCCNGMDPKPESTFPPAIVSSLVESGFVVVIDGMILRKSFYELFQKTQLMNMFSVNNHQEMVEWCTTNDSLYYLVHPQMIVDPCIFPVPIHVELPSDGSRICLLHLEQWSLNDLRTIFKNYSPNDVTAVGFATSKGNRFGYNAMHTVPENIPPVPTVDIQTIDFADIGKSTARCVMVKVGANLFHKSILTRVLNVVKKNTRNRMTCIADNLTQIPYEFRVLLDGVRSTYVSKERVLLDNMRSSFIDELSFKQSDPTKPPSKRRRLCPSTNTYRKKKKCVVALSDGTVGDFKKLRSRMKHWGIMKQNTSLVLFDDIILYLCSADVDPLIVHSLSLSAKRVVVVVPESVQIIKDYSWELFAFNNIK